MAHRECRHHEQMNKHQFRLSFSRAEIILINSWMLLQQIAYHLLRVFLKTERFTESADNSGSGTLSNYHIKTLMLWACELKPTSWWIDKLSFTAVCADLLHILSQWLNQGYCPHYFINGCNLFDHCDRANQILAAKRLSETNQRKLIKWLLVSYLSKCGERCSRYVSQLFDELSTNEKLQRAVSAAVDWRLSTVLCNTWCDFEFAQISVSAAVSTYSMSVRSYYLWMNELKKLDSRFCVYFMSVACLHVARKISKHGYTDVWMNLLSILCDVLDWIINLLKKKKSPEQVELLQYRPLNI